MADPLEIRAALVASARRHSRVRDEVEDVAHDVIVSALRRGIPLDSSFLCVTSRAARLHSAFLARCASRRQAREYASINFPETDAVIEEIDESTALSELSPSLRTTLLLLLAGLEKAELGSVLGVSDTALRKRFQALRERGPLARPVFRFVERTPALCRLRRTQVAVVPRLAERKSTSTARVPRLVAIGDPDGHGLIFAEALTRTPCTATTGAPPSNSNEARAKGSPCSTTNSRTSLSSSLSPTSRGLIDSTQKR